MRIFFADKTWDDDPHGSTPTTDWLIKMNMKCPYCGGEMVPGAAYISGTLLGMLFIGLSYQHLWFRRLDGSRKEKIIHSNDERAGHQCIQCGAVLVHRQRREWMTDHL
jgi:predicted RNA-binding Zn-ribbon protein involved in translation (DUF1610 family)